MRRRSGVPAGPPPGVVYAGKTRVCKEVMRVVPERASRDCGMPPLERPGGGGDARGLVGWVRGLPRYLDRPSDRVGHSSFGASGPSQGARSVKSAFAEDPARSASCP